MRNLVDRQDGVFYSLGDGYVMLTQPVGPCVFERGDEISITGMLSMWEIKLEGSKEVIGYFFYTAMKVKSLGGFLVTFMESKRGRATTATVVFRSEHLMVYDLQGCGSMAVSTKVNPSMLSILMEQ